MAKPLNPDLKADELVRWRATERSDPDWFNTVIGWNIFREGDKTFLLLLRSKWRKDAEIFPQTSMHRALFLLSLKEFLETGKGRPHPYDKPVGLKVPLNGKAREGCFAVDRENNAGFRGELTPICYSILSFALLKRFRHSSKTVIFFALISVYLMPGAERERRHLLYCGPSGVATSIIGASTHSTLRPRC